MLVAYMDIGVLCGVVHARICILQIRQVVSGDKVTPLQPAKKLTAAQFVQYVDRNTALQLVTLTPLFTCLNDTPKSK